MVDSKQSKGDDDKQSATTTATTAANPAAATESSPKKIFTELTELRSDGDQSYWKETARFEKPNYITKQTKQNKIVRF